MKTPKGKSAAMFWKDNIVIKLQGNALNEAMSLEGSQQFRIQLTYITGQQGFYSRFKWSIKSCQL
jgi:hypothetical protein